MYPYEYMNSSEICFDCKLSDKSEFYIPLKVECISEIDYLHAVNVWNTSKMKAMGNYHDIYLKADVLLIRNVF